MSDAKHPTHIKSRAAKLLVGAILTAGLVGMLAGQAGAATGSWQSVPSYGTGSGYAIIDSHSRGTFTSNAAGRVQITARSYCVRIQYAPYAVAALDGGWNNTSWNCSANTTRTFSWSDSTHLNYNGYKFRICTTAGCGSTRYISY
jgi:hypothetical protein